jgi:deoxyribose-phosphate aldolase
MKKLSKQQQIIDYCKKNPTATPKKVARLFKVTIQYVYSCKCIAKNRQKLLSTTVRKDFVPKQTVHKHIDSATVSVKIQLEMSSQRYFTMSIQEAQELYSTLKPLMER